MINSSTPARINCEVLALKIMPSLLLSCFAAQPLFAQTAEPTQPIKQESSKTLPKQSTDQAGTKALAALPANVDDKSKNTTSGAPETQTGGAIDMSTVEVVAQRQTNRIDRDVYALKDDISVTNASAADVLNNVPSVTVDPDGTVRLRGSSNVQVMVNGKPDARFQGQNRGDALNAYPAQNIESIEVITVPGAEFGNEGGSGPIINLVLKRNLKPGSSATLAVNQGDGGRYRHNLNADYAAGPYSLSGNLGVSKALNSMHRESDRENLNSQTGAILSSFNTHSDQLSVQQGVTLGSTLTYNVGERDQAGTTVSYSETKQASNSTTSNAAFGGNMLPLSQYQATLKNNARTETFGLGASYDHRGEQDEDLKFDLRYTARLNPGYQDTIYSYSLRPSYYSTNSHRDRDNSNRIIDLSVDYLNTIWKSWDFKAGAKYSKSTDGNATAAFMADPATGLYQPNRNLTSDFQTDERNAAIYGSLGTKIWENFQVLGGLRGEYDEMIVHQPLFNQQNRYRYTNWLPSFYAKQTLSKTGTLQFRVSRRIQRPNAPLLNPNLVYQSDLYAVQGNPNLKPVNNDSYEISYNETLWTIDSRFTLFKRLETPVVGYQRYPLATDPNVLVTSPINYGANDSVGLDSNFAIKNILPGLSATLGATLQETKRMYVPSQIRATTIPVEIKSPRSDAKASLRYQSLSDQMQFNFTYRGRVLNSQGATSASSTAIFNWQHKLSGELSLSMNVNNVFHLGRRNDSTENELLRLHNISTAPPRVFTIGLIYRWGGVKGDDRIRYARDRAAARGQNGTSSAAASTAAIAK